MKSALGTGFWAIWWVFLGLVGPSYAEEFGDYGPFPLHRDLSDLSCQQVLLASGNDTGFVNPFYVFAPPVVSGHAVLGRDAEMGLWNLSRGQFEKGFGSWSGHYLSAALSSDGRTLALGATAECRVDLFSIPTLTYAGPVLPGGKLHCNSKHRAGTVAFSPDGQYLAVLDYADGGWIHQKAPSGEWNAVKQIALDGFSDQAVFSPDGRWFLGTTRNGMHLLYDLKHLEKDPRRMLMSGGQETLGGAFTADSRFVYLGVSSLMQQNSRTLRVWDLYKKRWVGAKVVPEPVTQRWSDPTGAFHDLDGDPNSRLIFALSLPGTTRLVVSQIEYPHDTRFQVADRVPTLQLFIWDFVSGEKRELTYSQTISSRGESHFLWAMAAAATPDGKHFVTGDNVGAVRVFNTDSGEELYSFQPFGSGSDGVEIEYPVPSGIQSIWPVPGEPRSFWVADERARVAKFTLDID